MFEYESIRGVHYGLNWEFKGTVYKGKDFIEVLNILGAEGWQMIMKINNLEYVLMRKKSE